MKSRGPKRREAFTLIEVLLVLAILVILASAVAVNYIGRQKEALKDKAKVDIDLLETALKMYHLDMHTYPTTDQGLEALRQPPSDLPNPDKWGPDPYLEKDYDLWSLGPDGIDGTEDDISNWTQD